MIAAGHERVSRQARREIDPVEAAMAAATPDRGFCASSPNDR
jgi:hypothetical protein